MEDDLLKAYKQQEPVDPRSEKEKREDAELEWEVTQQLHAGWQGQARPDRLPFWNAVQEGCRFAIISIAGPGLPQRADRAAFKYRGAANTHKAAVELSARIHEADPTADTLCVPFGTVFVFPHAPAELSTEKQMQLAKEILSAKLEEIIHNRDDLSQRVSLRGAPPAIDPDEFFDTEKAPASPAPHVPQGAAVSDCIDPPSETRRAFIIWSVLRWKDRILLRLRATTDAGEDELNAKISRRSPLWDTYLTVTGVWLVIPDHPMSIGEDKLRYMHNGMNGVMTAQREQRKEQQSEVKHMEEAMKPEMLKEHEIQKYTERSEGPAKSGASEVPATTQRRRDFRELMRGKKKKE